MLKVMPWPWLSVSKQIWIRSFKWGTVRPCRSKGYKNIRGQSWRSKKICRFSQPHARRVRGWPSWQFSLQPLDWQECTVPHLKDLVHICLETKSQVYGMNFNKIYHRSKYPYFISYRGLFQNRSWLHCISIVGDHRILFTHSEYWVFGLICHTIVIW